MTEIYNAGNPYDVVRTSDGQYQASDGELVITDADTLQLPEPADGEYVLVKGAGVDYVDISTPVGNVGQIGEEARFDGDDAVMFVSDGNDWYIRSDTLQLSSLIPDSVVLQHFATTYTAGATTWADDNGVADMTLTGGETATTLSDGSDAVGFDGTNDHGLTTLPTSLEGASLQSQTIEFAVQYSESGGIPELFGTRNNDGNQEAVLRLNNNEAANSDDGNFFFSLRDDAGSTLRFSPDTNPGLNDGNRHDITIEVTDSTTNSVAIIIDGTSVSVAFGASDGPSSFAAWDNDCAWSARNDQGSIINHVASDIGAIRWHDEATGGQTIGPYP